MGILSVPYHGQKKVQNREKNAEIYLQNGKKQNKNKKLWGIESGNISNVLKFQVTNKTHS